MKQAKLLSQAEQKRVYAVIDAHRYSARNRAIFAFSFFAGLRACEIASLKVGDVFDASSNPRDTVFLASTQTIGGEAGTILVSKRLHKTLTAYAVTYPSHTSKPDAPLFFSRFNLTNLNQLHECVVH
jgi:integrase/recombinase XerD